MKNVIITLSLLLMAVVGSAQVELGLKAGLSSYDLADDIHEWRFPESSVKAEIVDASYGYHFGAYLRAKIFALYVEPAILFNSNSVSYNISSAENDEIFSDIKSETYRNVDVPILIGIEILFLRVHAGPVAHIFLESSSELTEVDGYSHKMQDARYGYQLGAGVDLGRISVDVNYENNFSSFGDAINLGGHSYTIDDNAARLVASIGYKF